MYLRARALHVCLFVCLFFATTALHTLEPCLVQPYFIRFRATCLGALMVSTLPPVRSLWRRDFGPSKTWHRLTNANWHDSAISPGIFSLHWSY
ncbi:hypothetical protein B0F90DRAFT_1778000 [Multifurca ochricompacta]|uniref:Secreted protein n=1 Tax=Multifurca ochricompacta TaxID=376703 RepID=A0AAD4LWY0_9AGAM|nr:hypothetical protein B0F90DRAFT_1784232 [Multifurca ochricompacta]KAI0291336.1 hypothetical protein B0F90DRAFT_1778000 [Multifurca ochricompacta]